MQFSKLSGSHLNHLSLIVGAPFVFTDSEIMRTYSRDETEDLEFFPEAVVKPRTPGEISEILSLCNKERIPVTPRGAGTGLSGGALPVCGGVLLSMERFNKIIEIDERNLQSTVEPGVITEVFQNAVKEKGLFYPPDPASKGSCFIGGNIAENAGGPKAVKYGVTRDYVLNLEAVLPTGEIIWTGANVLKNSTGYNLTHLLIGSEGTLGIITKAVVKLIPHPAYDYLMFVPFASPEDACNAVSAIFRGGITPSACEFIERDAFDYAFRYLGEEPLKIEKETGAVLILEVDGNHPDSLLRDCERAAKIMEEYRCGEILFADSSEQKEKIWKVRKCMGLAVKGTTIYKEEDTVVPRALLPELLKRVKEIGKKIRFSIRLLWPCRRWQSSCQHC